jgi:predicted transposase YbfD/YdcC
MDNIRLFNLHKEEKFTKFLMCINEIEDVRVGGRTTYTLSDVLVMIIFSILGGANNSTEIHRFVKRHVEWFQSFLPCNKIPCYSTFLRLNHNINPNQLAFWLNFWRQETAREPRPKHIALDGKEDTANGLEIVRAFDADIGAVIMHKKVDIKSNEIPAVQQILKSMSLKGAVVTTDAMHTQTNNACIITHNGGDYLFILKKNQGNLYDDVKTYIDDIIETGLESWDYDKFETIEKGHGRIEKRICISTGDIKWMTQRMRWAKLKTIGCIISYRNIKGKTTREIRYFISSLTDNSRILLYYIRKHWLIENICHRSLDIDFKADHSTIRDRTGALNMAIIKDFALSLIQKSDMRASINDARLDNAYSFNSLVKTLLMQAF